MDHDARGLLALAAAHRERLLPLAPHPDSPPGAVVSVAAWPHRTPDGRLVLAFALEGRLADLDLPPPGEPRRAGQLWRRTCFEAFIARADDSAYHEINLSPAREWDARAFLAYRDGGPLAGDGLAPDIATRRDGTRLDIVAAIELARLAPALRDAELRLGLAAVVAHAAGVSHWALRHAPGRADFHAPEGFVLRLAAPGR